MSRVIATVVGRDLTLDTEPNGPLVIGPLDPDYAKRLARAINAVPWPRSWPGAEVPAADVEAIDDEVKVIAICIAALMELPTPFARNRVADYIVNRCAGMA